MTQATTQFKIGVFVLAGLAIVIAGLAGFGLRRRLEPKTEFETYVPGSIDGLSTGSAVKLRGVQVGEVTRLGFSWLEYPEGRPSVVVVHFAVKASILPGPPTAETVSQGLGPGLRAIIEAQGITGVAVLSLENVDPAEYPPLEYTWKPRHVVIPSAPSQFNQILASAQGTLANLQKLDVERLVSHLDRVLDSADGALVELRGLAKDSRGSLRSMQLGVVGQDAHRLIVGLQESNAALHGLLDRFSSIDVRDLNETLAGTRQAARHLNDTLEQLNQYPSGFLFGKEPPPVTSVEKEK